MAFESSITTAPALRESTVWSRWSIAAGTALLVLVTCAAYWPGMTGGFILDDDLLLQNDLVRDPQHGLYRMWIPKSVQKLVGHEVPGEDPIDYWPLSNSSLWLEWRLWDENPRGYHVTNLLIHLAVSLLVWRALRQLAVPGAYLGAFLFAVHPVNVDSVIWISQRKTIMAMLFFLLSVIGYDRFDSGTRWPGRDAWASPWYWFSWLAFMAAMLSKGSVAPLPAVLLLLVWWKRNWIGLGDFVATAPFFLVSAGLTVVNILFQDHGGGPIRIAGFGERLAAAGAVPWFYLGKALLPFDLSFIYPLWKVSPQDPLWWAPLVGCFLVTGLLWWGRRLPWVRALLVAWLFFCLMLVPVMGFTDVSYMNWSLVADHYQYISLAAVTAVVAAGCYRFGKSPVGPRRVAASVMAGVLVAVLAALTWCQSRLYRDPITLYRSAIEQNPACWQAHYNLGRLYFAEGRLQDTIDASEASLHYAPENALPQNNAMAYNNIGTALFALGKKQEAIDKIRQALALDPKLARAQYNLANMLFETGQRSEAFEHYAEALAIAPNFDEAHANLGTALNESGLPQEAIPHFQTALLIKPDNPEVWCNLGVALLNVNRPQEAIARFEQALKLRPAFPLAHDNLAKALLATGQQQQALEHFQQAIAIDPGFVQGHVDLGLELAKMGRAPEGLPKIQQAASLQPDDPTIQCALGTVLLDLDRPAEALVALQKAVEKKRDYIEAQWNLAGAYAKLGRYGESLATAEKTLILAREQNRNDLIQPIENLMRSVRSVSPKAEASPGPGPIPSPALPPSP